MRCLVFFLDFERGFFILQIGIGCLRSRGEWAQTWEVFRQKHGALADYVAPTLEEIVRRDGLAALRSSITDVEHRFFLALLLNVPGRAELLAMVAQRFPGAPVETILRWAGELGESSETGTWLLDAPFPGDEPEVVLAALRHLLGAGASALPAKKLKALRAVFAGSSFGALMG